MSESLDSVVIGAGVVGLAIGRALAHAGHEVVVLEQHAQIGTVTSSRNSEVIHAGIYYPAGSHKARFCVAGRERLYQYCADKHIPHRRCSKLIVAGSEDQHARLAQLQAQALSNGVADLEWIDRQDLAKLEPAVRGSAALWSPSTGIVDSHAFMLALRGDLEAQGGQVAVQSQFTRGRITRAGFEVTVSSEGQPLELTARRLVNAAGLEARSVALRLEGMAAEHVPAGFYAKGNYFMLSGASPFRHLVYPLPEPGGLGIHATLDLAGRIRFGPDVEWIDAPDYTVDAARADRFYAAIRRYWPDLPDDALHAGYAGVRPKLAGPGEPPADFMIQGPAQHGCPGLVQLFGIESPGLTAALALGDHVADLLR
jgi:L-2-hydroxyglutarate oxidase LhgO